MTLKIEEKIEEASELVVGVRAENRQGLLENGMRSTNKRFPEKTYLFDEQKGLTLGKLACVR